MLWIVAAILSYFLFALVSLVDRHLLIGAPTPKTYAFYVGILSGWALLLFLFFDFYFLPFYELLFCLLAGAIFIFAILALYEGLENFEASKIIPAFGGFLPIFTFLLSYFLVGEKLSFGSGEFISFGFLVFGSFFIGIERSFKFSIKSLEISLLIALLFSLYFILSKFVYIFQPFWQGFIWIRLGAFFTAVLFILFKEVRNEILAKTKFSFTKKTGLLFCVNQLLGAGAVVLQNWSIALAGFAYLAIINALQGTQYAFLFILSLFSFLVYPSFAKEDFTKKIVIQKILAIIIIGIGLAIFSLAQQP